MHARAASLQVLRVARAALIIAIPLAAAGADLPVLNPGFEDASTSGQLLKWSAQIDPGTRLQDCEVKREGRCSLHLSSASLAGRQFVPVSQTLLAAGIDGKAVRLSGWIKVSGHTSGLASLWLRIDGPGGREKLDNMAGRAPKGSTDWQRFESELPLTTNSRIIAFGALFGGDGEAWFDDLKIEVIPGERSPAIVPPSVAQLEQTPSQPSPYSVAGTRPLTWLPQFDDLAFLKPLLQEKRIVALGESGHGVAQFNSIKVRMIKYLHEQLGYNLIAFESPMAACAAADTKIGKETPAKVMRECMFPVWHSRENLELFEYIENARAAGRELHITGFDIQDVGLQPGAMDDLKRLLGSGQAPLLARLEAAEARVRTVRMKGAGPTDAAEMDIVYRTLASVLSEQEPRSNDDDAAKLAFLRMQMLSRAALVATSVAAPGSLEAIEARDAAMAANFNYLMQRRHPGQKVIVWGHNSHVAKQWPVPNKPRIMGHHLAGTYGKSLYVIGLVMGRGRAANNARVRYEVTQPHPASLEGAFAGAAVKMGFLDLTSGNAGWMSQPLLTRNWGTIPISITPDASFDGLIYVDIVTPPDYM